MPVQSFLSHVAPNREKFAADPIGYSASAWQCWGLAQTIAGFPVDIDRAPTVADLKDPVLWLCHAHALSQSAVILLRNTPNLELLPELSRGVCDRQYCAVALMLVSYSLEVCLKGMLILQKGVDQYLQQEKSYQHHRLVDLADFVPDMSTKDKAILKALSHFSYWAGRYPDPGAKRIDSAEDIFDLSEENQITAHELFDLSARVMKHARSMT